MDVQLDREKRAATLTIAGPEVAKPSTPAAIVSAGDQFWPLRAFRGLDDALLRLRVAEPLIGTIVLKTRGDQDALIALDQLLPAHQDHWLVRGNLDFLKRSLKRLGLTPQRFLRP